MTQTRKPKLGRRKPLPEEGPGSFSQRVTFADDEMIVEIEVYFSFRRLTGPQRTGVYARTISVRRPDGGPVAGRDLKRMPATRYIDRARAAVGLAGVGRLAAGYARLGLTPPEELPGRKADLERRVSPGAKTERGRGMRFWIEFNREYAEIEARGGSPTKELARKHKVKPETIRVWRHRHGPKEGKGK